MMLTMEARNARFPVKHEPMKQVFEQRPEKRSSKREEYGECAVAQAGVIDGIQNHYADQGRVDGEVSVVRGSALAHHNHSERVRKSPTCGANVGRSRPESLERLMRPLIEAMTVNKKPRYNSVSCTRGQCLGGCSEIRKRIQVRPLVQRAAGSIKRLLGRAVA